MRNKSLIIILILFGSINLEGQEILTGLSENARVKAASKKISTHTFDQRNNAELELPFLDDFSNPGVFPNDTLWQDRDVFINNSYSVEPFNIGVATFDALNDTGSLHSNSLPSIFFADTLTSRNIRLDSITSINKKLSPADSLYLSFYVQPQGTGNAPEAEDSLVLKFYAPQQQKWVHIWGIAGTDLQTFYDSNLVYTKRIMIPLIDTMFFHRGFKMMFMNYASLSNNSIPSWVGNVDIWNLDYVHLDYQRVHDDTSLVDWTLTSEAHSLLSTYEQMPWNQYKVNPVVEMEDTFRISYRSNKGHRKDVNMTFRITDLSGLSTPYNTFPSPITNQKMPSFSTFTFEHFLDYNYPSNTQKYNDFELLFHINVPDDPFNFNDTSRFYQRFYNYYAYDDGSAEAGYGLSSIGARMAYQFTLNQPDTLRSVQMFFNKVKNDANIKPFTLTIWDDNTGEPGNIIYEQSGEFPVIKPGYNRFHTYVLDEPQGISGTFYVGWQQTTSDNLNLGFDVNRNARSHIFYNTFGSWNNTIYEGALMIRPILGDSVYAHVGMTENTKKQQIVIYPNPVSSGKAIHLQTDFAEKEINCRLFSIRGRFIQQFLNTKVIQLPELESGIYLLEVSHKKTGYRNVEKIIIN